MEKKTIYIRQVLENAPVDDEPLTEEDKKAILEAEEDIREGRTISIEELAKQYGISESLPKKK